MYQKKETIFLQKMCPHLSQLMLRWLIRLILGEIICKSLNWQHIQRLKITTPLANWQLFKLEKIAKCSYFILSTQNIKFYWFVMKKKKKICGQFDDTIEVNFLLGIVFWGLRSEWVKGQWCLWMFIHVYVYSPCTNWKKFLSVRSNKNSVQTLWCRATHESLCANGFVPCTAADVPTSIS